MSALFTNNAFIVSELIVQWCGVFQQWDYSDYIYIFFTPIIVAVTTDVRLYGRVVESAILIEEALSNDMTPFLCVENEYDAFV